jgi:3-dehydroquinate dehydratase/shikimate dehydrogenase
MHNAGFDDIGLDAVYVPFEAADADDFAAFARALDVKGASVTAPFKRDIMALADEVEPLARRLGAANTLRQGPAAEWQARNTDVEGFLEPLRGAPSAIGPGTRATVMGAGGAARAVAVALASAGCHVTVCARNPQQARAVAALAGAAIAVPPPQPGSWDLLVNATPVGTHPAADETILGASWLDGRLVYDLVYNPPATRLLRDARQRGCRTIGGLEMLVAQAELQFEWWTGGRPRTGLFREAAMRGLARQHGAAAEASPIGVRSP